MGNGASTQDFLQGILLNNFGKFEMNGEITFQELEGLDTNGEPFQQQVSGIIGHRDGNPHGPSEQQAGIFFF